MVLALRYTLILLVLCVTSFGAVTSNARTAPAGYLGGAPLAYVIPPAPTDAEEVRLDLLLVRKAVPPKGSLAEQEAIADAEAYYAKDLIARFSDAAGTTLDKKSRPALTFVLSRALADAGAYAAAEKLRNPRPRPYVEDPSILPCNRAFLKDQESYPSGHAMNGYVAALLLADLIPDHRRAILERGVRYGENRVACGVHHPTDVEQGRLLAIAYVEALRVDKFFVEDFACAKAEQQRIGQPHLPQTSYCQSLLAQAVTVSK